MARRSASMRKRMRRERFDHVYCMTSACLLAAPVARSLRIRSVGLHVQEMWSGKEAVLLRALARFTTLRITISPAVDRAARLRDPASVVVDNCVPHPANPNAAVPDAGPRPRYVVASRWNAWKGHRTLIDAWGRAGCPGTLTVLGGPPPSGTRVDVPALVAALADPSSVEIVGEVPDIEPYIAAADALVLPSDEPEPFGLVLLEAFRQGRPVIASRAGGPVDIVDDGVDGWLFTPGDAADLARLLERLTVDDLADAGRHARQTYLGRYTPEFFQQHIAELFRVELARASGERRSSTRAGAVPAGRQ
jgi:glycosyltransferase involved in cell wall biosynthesis